MSCESYIDVPTGDLSVELSIVIVNWNSSKFVRECVNSVQSNAPACTWEIVVIDSGSFDDCGKMLSREFPWVHFVQCQNNVGFAAGNNLGAKHARGRILLFLNPDTEVSAGALDLLVKTLKSSPSAGLVGARLLNSDRSLQTSCVQAFPTVLNQVLDAEWLRRSFPQSYLWGMSTLFAKTEKPSAVEVISGACIMIRRQIFDQISGFDQRYFMYSDDLDLCYRVKKRGFDCLYVPGARIVHHGGGSSSVARSMFSVIMMRESVSRFLKIHHGSGTSGCYRAMMGLSALVRLPLLALGLAVRCFSGRSASASIRKWVAILRWSLGLETWASKKTGGNNF